MVVTRHHFCRLFNFHEQSFNSSLYSEWILFNNCSFLVCVCRISWIDKLHPMCLVCIEILD